VAGGEYRGEVWRGGEDGLFPLRCRWGPRQPLSLRKFVELSSKNVGFVHFYSEKLLVSRNRGGGG